MSLAERILAGDRLALARLLTQIENEDAAGFRTLAALFPHTGRAHLIGITGAPGSGKSTLVNRLALELRRRTGATVGIVAVDPTSPVHRRRAARRPHPHARPERRPRRLHPQHGHPRQRWAAWRGPPPTWSMPSTPPASPGS